MLLRVRLVLCLADKMTASYLAGNQLQRSPLAVLLALDEIEHLWVVLRERYLFIGHAQLCNIS